MIEETDGVEFPIPHDIEYVEGVRLTRRLQWFRGRVVGSEWVCPHGTITDAKASRAASKCLIEHPPHETDEGYTYSDPKHPAYHTTHSDWWDNRDKTEGR